MSSSTRGGPAPSTGPRPPPWRSNSLHLVAGGGIGAAAAYVNDCHLIQRHLHDLVGDATAGEQPRPRPADPRARRRRSLDPALMLGAAYGISIGSNLAAGDSILLRLRNKLLLRDLHGSRPACSSRRQARARPGRTTTSTTPTSRRRRAWKRAPSPPVRTRSTRVPTTSEPARRRRDDEHRLDHRRRSQPVRHRGHAPNQHRRPQRNRGHRQRQHAHQRLHHAHRGRRRTCASATINWFDDDVTLDLARVDRGRADRQPHRAHHR